MSHIAGVDREQSALFPLSLCDLVTASNPCRVIEAFVDTLCLSELGFSKAKTKGVGRPPYDPADLLKLYLYGYLNQVRSSRRLERECQRNVEVMWLVRQLIPDHKTIANFRKDNSDALMRAGSELVRFCRGAGLIRGQCVAIDGSKFQAVASRKSVVSPKSLERQEAWIEQRMAKYLAQLDAADETEEDTEIDRGKVLEAVEELRKKQAATKALAAELKAQGNTHVVLSEPEARLMRKVGPGYNLQSAVDEHSAMIVAHELNNEATDNRMLRPMAQAAKAILNVETLDVLADAGYSNGAQAAELEAQQILVHAPANRSINSSGDGTLLDKSKFVYSAETDTLTCPNGKTLKRGGVHLKDQVITYRAQAQDCQTCPLKPTCTEAKRRSVTRHVHEDALQRMDRRATQEAMRRRRCTVEHPFAGLKYRIFGHPRLLMRGLIGARAEMAIATTVWNLKRAMAMMGTRELQVQLAS